MNSPLLDIDKCGLIFDVEPVGDAEITPLVEVADINPEVAEEELGVPVIGPCEKLDGTKGDTHFPRRRPGLMYTGVTDRTEDVTGETVVKTGFIPDNEVDDTFPLLPDPIPAGDEADRKLLGAANNGVPDSGARLSRDSP